MNAEQMTETMTAGTGPRFFVSAAMFDLDGTLIDSINVYYKVVQTVFDRLGLSRVSRDQIYAAVEDGRFYWDRVLPAEETTAEKGFMQRAMVLAREVYPDIFRRTVDVFDGVPAFLADLQARGIRIGVVTATPGDRMVEKEALLAQKGVRDCIDVLVTNDDAPNPKPAPDTILACCERLSIRPAHGLYAGDTSVDIRAGKAAGTRTAAVLTGFDRRQTLMDEHPDIVLNRVTDLAGMIVKKR